MSNLVTQIRGALLEEAILFLLGLIGYQTVDHALFPPGGTDGMRAGHSGLELQGRGTWHQLDALAIWPFSPAFMYPLRLIVEAKCYAIARPIGVEVPRNSVGVLKDISENYFTYNVGAGGVRGPRFNYTSAIFSTSGYTRGAIEYAVAHQIFLIQYDHMRAIAPLIQAIQAFQSEHLTEQSWQALGAVRRVLRKTLNGEQLSEQETHFLSPSGLNHIRNSVAEACNNIHGSYFGMLQGRWPMHLLRRVPLPPQAFSESDQIFCRIHSEDGLSWSFVPAYMGSDSEGYFELEFSLPPLILEMVQRNWDDPIQIASLKQEFFSFIDLTGKIGGIRRNIRLQLDRDWIQEYIQRLRAR